MCSQTIRKLGRTGWYRPQYLWSTTQVMIWALDRNTCLLYLIKALDRSASVWHLRLAWLNSCQLWGTLAAWKRIDRVLMVQRRILQKRRKYWIGQIRWLYNEPEPLLASHLVDSLNARVESNLAGVVVGHLKLHLYPAFHSHFEKQYQACLVYSKG